MLRFIFYCEFFVLEAIIIAVISLLLGLGFFWALYSAQPQRYHPGSRLRWGFIFLIGPAAIEAIWLLPGYLAG